MDVPLTERRMQSSQNNYSLDAGIHQYDKVFYIYVKHFFRISNGQFH